MQYLQLSNLVVVEDQYDLSGYKLIDYFNYTMFWPIQLIGLGDSDSDKRKAKLHIGFLSTQLALLLLIVLVQLFAGYFGPSRKRQINHWFALFLKILLYVFALPIYKLSAQGIVDANINSVPAIFNMVLISVIQLSVSYNDQDYSLVVEDGLAKSKSYYSLVFWLFMVVTSFTNCLFSNLINSIVCLFLWFVTVSELYRRPAYLSHDVNSFHFGMLGYLVAIIAVNVIYD